MSEEICIRITRYGAGKPMLTATISRTHKGVRGLKWVPLKTISAPMKMPYADGLTPKMLAAMAEAVQLVAAGFYEDVELPF